MRFWILFLFLVPTFVQAKSDSWMVKSGTLKYTLTHMLHTVEGKSSEVKGLGKCDSTCQFLVAAPVKSFGSENSNRDSNMQVFTRAASNPLVEIRTNVKPKAGKSDCDVEIKLAGKTHPYRLSIEFKPEGSGFEVLTVIPMKLSNFDIDAPSLMGVKASDEVPVSVDLHILPSV